MNKVGEFHESQKHTRNRLFRITLLLEANIFHPEHFLLDALKTCGVLLTCLLLFTQTPPAANGPALSARITET